jgi:hypothetical protein
VTGARPPPGPRPGGSGPGELRAELLARLLAPPAFLRADAAVLMVVCVALALVGARTARRQAGLQRVELRGGMGIGLAGEDACGAGARVRAVEAQTDAADEATDVVLGLARVRADRAARLTRAALVEAPRQHGDIGDQRPRMGSQDVLDAHGLSLVVVVRGHHG